MSLPTLLMLLFACADDPGPSDTGGTSDGGTTDGGTTDGGTSDGGTTDGGTTDGGCEDSAADCTDHGCTLDLDLDAALVDFRFTLNGEVVPSGSQVLQLDLVDTDTQHELSASVNSASFADAVHPGTFDLYVTPDSIDAGDGSDPTRVLADIAVTGDRSIEADMYTATLGGDISIDGVPAEDADCDFVELWFVEHSNSRGTHERFYGSDYDLELLHGTYDLFAEPDCTGLAEGRWPLTTDVVLDGDTTLDLDLQTATLSGTITVDGGPLPDLSTSSTTFVLTLEDDSSGASATASFTTTGSYSLVAPPGTYALRLRLQDDTGGGTWEVATDIDLSGDKTLDLDLDLVAVSGQLTWDGGPLPVDSGSSYHQLEFVETTTGLRASHRIQDLDTGAFQLSLPPGSYDIYLLENITTDYDSLFWKLATERVIDADSSFDLDLDIVDVHGTVTMNGAPLPEGSRFSLDFEQPGNDLLGLASQDFEGTGAFSLSLPAGIATVAVSIEGILDQSHQVAVDLLLEDGAELALDLALVELSGTLLYDGGAFPEPLSGSTWQQLVFHERTTGEWQRWSGTEAKPTYSLWLPPGDYDVEAWILGERITGVRPVPGCVRITP